jgi:hypothetical protein
MAFTKSMIIWAKDKATVEKEVIAQTFTTDGQNNPVETVYYGDEDKPEEEEQVSYNSLALDCVLQEGHVLSNEVTKYPVSSGFLIGEHIIRHNPRFHLNGIITNVSMPGDITLIGTVGKIAGAMVSRVIGPVLGSLLSSAAHMIENSGITTDPIKEAFLQLKKLVNDGTIVHVATIIGTYEGCILREVRINQDGRTATILPVLLTFEQMYIIQPDGSIGYELPADQKQALQTLTPSDTKLMINMLKLSGVNILGSIL